MVNIKRKNDTFITASQINHYCKRNKHFPGFTFRLISGIFKENPRDQLTVFLDFFLTK